MKRFWICVTILAVLFLAALGNGRYLDKLTEAMTQTLQSAQDLSLIHIYLTVYIALPDPAGNQLIVLAAEIQDDDRFMPVGHFGLPFLYLW